MTTWLSSIFITTLCMMDNYVHLSNFLLSLSSAIELSSSPGPLCSSFSVAFRIGCHEQVYIMLKGSNDPFQASFCVCCINFWEHEGGIKRLITSSVGLFHVCYINFKPVKVI